MKIYKVEKGILYESEVKDETKFVGDCYGCGLPVYISSGQLYNLKNDKPSHKRCR